MTSLAARVADRLQIARAVVSQAKREPVGGFLGDRLRILRSVLARSPVVRRVSIADGLSQVVKWYRFQRVRILKGATVRDLDESFVWVDISPLYGLAWPREGNLSRLGAGLVELWCPSNPHYYFIPSTRVKPGDVVVDVGCSEGAFALDCLKRFQAGEVWCFEPSPRMAQALRITADRNGLEDRMHVVDAAVSNTSGAVEFREDPADPLGGQAADLGAIRGPAGGDAIVNRVPQTTLDDWARERGIERLDYLKVDAEGYDLAVLEGARRCLTRWRPTVVVTTYHRPEHCEQIYRYLRSLGLGYRIQVKGIAVHKVGGGAPEDLIPRPVMLHAAVRS